MATLPKGIELAERHSILSCTRILKGRGEFMICKNQAPDGGVDSTELPFTPETIKRIEPFFTDKTIFQIRDDKKSRLYRIPRAEWEELDRESLIDYGIFGRRRERNERSKI
jgi:hypothetical protein